MSHRALGIRSSMLWFTSVLTLFAPIAKAEPGEGAEPAAAQSEQVERLTPVEVYNGMLPSTCWLVVEWSEGDFTHSRYGTGWVYDLERRLVVTNEHVIHDQDTATAYFPQSIDGELVHDPQWYFQSGAKHSGVVIDRDTERDLALLQLEVLPSNAAALKLADKSPLPGERLFALAGLPQGSEGLWIMTSGEVRQVYRRSHANGHFARVVETQLPTNGGNSGGAVVNDRLQVVAVVEGAMLEASLVRMFIDVNEIRDFLGEAVPLVEPTTAEAFEIRASRRYDEGRYGQAVEDYTAALRLQPRLVSALMNRGWAYYHLEDYETSAADFEAALQIDPELGGAYEGRGTCRREMGQYQEAIRDLTEAIRRAATDPDNYERRAKCYAALGRHEVALKDRNRAIELAPDTIDYLMGRAQTYRALKRFKTAQQDLEKAISLDPTRSETYYELGHVYYDQAAYPQARMFFDMAVQRDTNAPSYVYMRGMSSYGMEEYETAAADIAQAIALKPDTSWYHWNLGMSLWYLDRDAEAAEQFTEYIRLLPDNPDGYETRADIYEEMGRDDLAEADRATMRRLKRDQN